MVVADFHIGDRRRLGHRRPPILGPFGPPSHLREAGLRIAERGGKSAKKRAVIAVARKLAVTLLALWKSGADYHALPLAA